MRGKRGCDHSIKHLPQVYKILLLEPGSVTSPAMQRMGFKVSSFMALVYVRLPQRRGQSVEKCLNIRLDFPEWRFAGFLEQDSAAGIVD